MIETLNQNILVATRCYIGGGKTPTPPPPPPRPPERGDSAKLVTERNQSFSRKGRFSTILGGATANLAPLEKKTLLGG